MLVTQTNFLNPYIKQGYFSSKNKKETSFGTRHVNLNDLFLTRHAKQRMRERQITLKTIKEAIAKGKAFLDGKKLVVLDNHRSGVVSPEDTLTVIGKSHSGKTYNRLVTVYHPFPNQYGYTEDGFIKTYRDGREKFFAVFPEN